MGKQEAVALVERVEELEAAMRTLQNGMTMLGERLNRHVERGDTHAQTHADVALALRQVSGALEDLVRRGTK